VQQYLISLVYLRGTQVAIEISYLTAASDLELIAFV
jgi:hypothetical protein